MVYIPPVTVKVDVAKLIDLMKQAEMDEFVANARSMFEGKEAVKIGVLLLTVAAILVIGAAALILAIGVKMLLESWLGDSPIALFVGTVIPSALAISAVCILMAVAEILLGAMFGGFYAIACIVMVVGCGTALILKAAGFW